MKKNGFTIIEIVIAIAIIAFGVLAAASLFPYGIKIDRKSSLETVATGLAQGVLDEILSTSYTEMQLGTTPKTPYSTDPNSELAKFQKQTSIEYVDSNLAHSETDTGLKKITVTIFWPMGENEKNTQLITLYAKK